ncbi:ParB/RepB/Spo0J family partition protein [Luteimonas soli]|uniref:ParB/RepB/Spo0J family partition protein n=1 Tax=Luteimonas soli TaxID=1648966 RepID=A0ABV7XK97_9GAMM
MLDAPADAAGVREIPLDLIDPDPEQPRKTFDQAKLLELAESIKAHGVIQPVVLRTSGDRFELIAGERRWRAAALAKLETVPAIIRDDLSARAQMVENLQREDLSAFEIYRVIAAELDAGTSQKELATAYGKSKPWVSDYAAVAKMPPALQDALRDGRASDISALAALARLHKQAPAQVEQLAESGAPITRHLVNQLADSLARKATGADGAGTDPGKAPAKTKAEPKATGAQSGAGEDGDDDGEDDGAGAPPSSGVADNGEGLDVGGRGPAAVPGAGDGSTKAGDNYTPPKALPQDLPVGIKVQYEGDTYWLRYDRQKAEGGRRLVMIATDTGLTLYAPLADLVLEAIYPHHDTK